MSARIRLSGFTLVELLVVIGIIAVLISLLLPALGRARQQARAVACASNLRQIAVSMAMYIEGNKGALPPMQVGTASYANAPYPNGEFWANLLVRGKYLTAPDLISPDGSWRAPPSSVLRCPSGTDERLLGWSMTTPRDGVNNYFNYPFFDTSGNPIAIEGNAVPAWYVLVAYNGAKTPSGSGVRNATPFMWVPGGNRTSATADPVNSVSWRRTMQDVRRASDMAMIIDGVAGSVNFSIARIAGRHPRFSGSNGSANIAFFDGHVQMYSTEDIAQLALRESVANGFTASTEPRYIRSTGPLFNLNFDK